MRLFSQKNYSSIRNRRQTSVPLLWILVFLSIVFGFIPTNLFAQQKDPNIIDTEEGRQIAEKLKQEMKKLKKETGYQFHHRG